MATNTRSALRLALIATALISVTACASKPKPAPQVAPPAQTQAPPPAYTAPPPAAVSTAPLAGSEQDFVINVGDRVYFDFDSYSVRADASPLLDGQAAWLKRYPAVQVRIEGNCDERGTREYNLALGARRANAVRDYLVAQGIDPTRITTVSYGKEKPIDLSGGESADAHNRNGHTAIISGARMQ